MIRFCTSCVMSSTRPDLHLDDVGVCSACRSIERNNAVDWDARALQFDKLVAWAKSTAQERGSDYDCVVGVSGGKDSWHIVLTALEAGLRVLGVHFTPSCRSEIGERNLAGLVRLHDVIEVRRRDDVYHAIRRFALKTVGDSEWAGHRGIFTSVLREAVPRQIPLVLWGENSQAEYAPPSEESEANDTLGADWIEEFGGLLGLRVQDVADAIGVAPDQLVPYTLPPPSAMGAIRSRFLGHYFYWDTLDHAAAVREDGFEWGSPPRGAIWPFENLDDPEAVAFHDFLGLCKFGYTRAHAQLSVEIRHGYRARESAVAILQATEWDQYPIPDVEERFCQSIGLSPEEVRAACESFANPAIWEGPPFIRPARTRFRWTLTRKE